MCVENIEERKFMHCDEKNAKISSRSDKIDLGFHKCRIFLILFYDNKHPN